MSYEFKNLSDVEPQDKPTENTTVMAFENGVPKQIPAGEFGGKGLVVSIGVDDIAVDEGGNVIRIGIPEIDGDAVAIQSQNYDKLYETLVGGGIVYMKVSNEAKSKLEWSGPSGGELVVSWGLTDDGLYITGGYWWYGFIFTNGSYHTTETASE